MKFAQKLKKKNCFLVRVEWVNIQNWKASSISITCPEFYYFPWSLPTLALYLYSRARRQQWFNNAERELWDDPKASCVDYARNSTYGSYDRCIEEEVSSKFMANLGCNAPWFTRSGTLPVWRILDQKNIDGWLWAIWLRFFLMWW